MCVSLVSLFARILHRYYIKVNDEVLQFREKQAEFCGFSLHVFFLAPFHVGSLVVIVQFVVDLVVLLEIFRAPRQDMDVDMLDNSF